MFPPTCPPLEPGEVELEFETLESYSFSGGSEGIELPSEGLLVVMNDAEDYLIPNPHSRSSKRLQKKIDDMNFEQHFVVAVARRGPSSGSHVNINRITQQGGELRVCTQFWGPGRNQASVPSITYPYHFVKVTRYPNLDTLETAVLHTLTVRGAFPITPEPN